VKKAVPGTPTTPKITPENDPLPSHPPSKMSLSYEDYEASGLPEEGLEMFDSKQVLIVQ